MTDRVYPSSKPNGTTAAAAANGGAATATTNPPTKSHLYNPNRHPYRPQPNRHRRPRSGRSCLCLCCFWSILILLGLLLLAAIAGCVAYVLYSPRRPAFSVTALRISKFNLSTTAADDTTHLTVAINITLSAKNPNKKIIYFYDPFSISTYSNQVQIANGSFPSFTSYSNNITILRSSLASTSELIYADDVPSLRSDLKKKNGLPLKIQMDTKVVVKMEKLKSKKVGIRVICDGIRGILPKGKSTLISSTSNAKCKVDLRIKIWKFTF